MTLYLLTYNNYYNRIVKKEDTLAAYQDYLVTYNGAPVDRNGNRAIIQDVNFIEKDFIDTTQVVNWDGDIPNYILVTDDNIIKSRWFVIDSIKTRMGQLSLTLHRDVVVDFYDEAKQATIFVEKATLANSSDLIYNSEDMTFNQIKKKETLIKDESGCPWVVLYTDQKTRLQTTIDSIEGNIAVTYSSPAEFQKSPIYQAYASTNKFIGSPSTIIYNRWRFYFQYYSSSSYVAPFYEFSSDAFERLGVTTHDTNLNHLQTTINSSDGFDLTQLTELVTPGVNILKTGAIGLLDDLKTQGFWVNESVYNDCKALANQVVRVVQSDGTYKYYRILCSPTSIDNIHARISDQNIWNAIKTKGIQMGILQSTQVAAPYNDLYMTVEGYLIDIQEASVDSLSIDILPSNYTKDVPYNILAIPFSDTLKIKNSLFSNFSEVTSNKSLALNTAKSLILAYAGAGALYDAQILPYCPFTSSIIDKANNALDVHSPNALSWVPIQTSSGIIQGYVFRIEYSSFNRRIPLEEPVIIGNKKIEALTDVYRLSSPNFSSMFEFNAAKNNGISSFAISCTYKPYNPYIKVRPDFKGLYGSDFDDSRGLILSGDYSLPMTTDAWKTYELQNKNYQASFDRQILSMEINNNIARQQERWQVAAGTVSGGVSGGIGGAIMGGPYGAITGTATGAASAAFSLVGGLKDIEFNEQLRKEAMSLAKDQFGYSLGNIKALPIGLSKTAAYNIDNKYFPFLEYYTCTDEEKIALAYKIRNNGMTVGRILTWSTFINNTWEYKLPTYKLVIDRGYFKGKLISIDARIPTNIVRAIANEFYQGVYLR